MIKVAITGGIGAGKSTVSQLFKELGVPIFNSDKSAREAENDFDVIKGFKQIFGDDIYVNGVLDRPKMRSIAFVDKDKLKLINDLITPYVSSDFETFMLVYKDSDYVLLESAIIFETNIAKNFDYIISVIADTDIRINRVIARDNATFEEVQNKLNNQLSDKERVAKSDYVIINNEVKLIDSLDVLKKQIKAIHQAISGNIYANKIIDLFKK